MLPIGRNYNANACTLVNVVRGIMKPFRFHVASNTEIAMDFSFVRIQGRREGTPDRTGIREFESGDRYSALPTYDNALFSYRRRAA